jgi:hypothetical protein
MRAEGLTLILLTGACGSSRIPETKALVSDRSEVEINRIVETAIMADARGEAADTLYAPYATLIADGRVRRRVPRLAGVAEGGEIAVTSTQLQTRGTAAWADAEYRWVSGSSNRIQVGRASFVLTSAPGRPGWWIVQLHSSTVR